MSKLGNLLAWSVENTAPANSNAPNQRSKRQLDPQLLAQLFGQQDEATMMKEAMAAIQDPAVSIKDKEIAFDNFEMMIEQLDNANNIENLKLWGPLIDQLSANERHLRFMAAWCCGTAVQNNPKSQAAFFKAGGVHKIVELALEDDAADVRKKAVFAISCAVRNSAPSLKILIDRLPKDLLPKRHLEAEDMEGIDVLMNILRNQKANIMNQ